VGDTPARHRGRGLDKRIAALAGRPRQQHGQRSGAFGRKLEPAGLGHLDTLRLADNRAEPAMPQPLLQQREKLGIVPRLGVEHTVRVEPRLVETGREQIAGAQNPEHLAPDARRDPCNEQDRGRIVTPARPARRHFMECIEPQPAVRETPVEQVDPERQDQTAPPLALNGAERVAQAGDDG